MTEVNRRMPCGAFVTAEIDPDVQSSKIELDYEARLHEAACQECRDWKPVRWPQPSHRDQRGYSAF